MKSMLAKKIPPATDIINTADSEFVTFSKAEWNHFKNEINKQLSEKNGVIDFGKAARNARYLAKLDRAFSDKGGVKMTFDALENLIKNEGHSISR